jgi:DNA-binding protein Fis
LHEEVRREVDRILLPLVMEHTLGNQNQASKLLGVSRLTLRRRLRDHQITPHFINND